MELGIQFEEQLAGYFSLETLNPESGEQRGRSNHQHLLIHNRVKIENLRSWLKTGKCTCELTGSVDFTPLGFDLPIQSGHFNLVSYDELLEVTLLIYEVHFKANEKKYLLTGRKQVSLDHRPALWADVSTVYAQLHAGDNQAAPIAGAGILKLDLDDVFDMLSTITVLGTDSAREKALAVRQFGQVYLGELWKTCAAFVGCGGGPAH